MSSISYFSNSLSILHEQIYKDWDIVHKQYAPETKPMDKAILEEQKNNAQLRTLILKVGCGTSVVFAIFNSYFGNHTLTRLITIGTPLVLMHDLFHLTRNFEKQMIAGIKADKAVQERQTWALVARLWDCFQASSTPVENNTLLTFVWRPLINRLIEIKNRMEAQMQAEANRK